jgi:hypothetical protein
VRSIIDKLRDGRWWVLLLVLSAPAAACEIIADIPDVVDGRDVGSPGPDGDQCPALDLEAGKEDCQPSACQPTLFLMAQEPVGIAIHAGTVYWAEQNRVFGASTASKEKMHFWEPVAPAEVVADESGVYWTHTSGKCVGHGPADGRQMIEIGSCMGTRGGQIALDGTHVYWVVGAESDGGTGSIMRAAKEGLVAEPYASYETSPLAVAIDAKFVYWSNRTSENEGVIKRCPKDRCEDASVPFVEDAGDLTRMAIDGDYLYWLDKGHSQVRRVSTTAPNPKIDTVAADQPNGSSLVVDDTFVYWCNGSGEIWRRRKLLDADAEQIGGDAAHSVAVDCLDVYWTERPTDAGEEGVFRVPR